MDEQDYFGTVSIHTRVTDPQALWRKARDYLVIDNGIDPDDEQLASTIGTEAAPNIGSCLIMLLDRSEFLDGAEIVESGYDGDEPDHEDD